MKSLLGEEVRSLVSSAVTSASRSLEEEAKLQGTYSKKSSKSVSKQSSNSSKSLQTRVSQPSVNQVEKIPGTFVKKSSKSSSAGSRTSDERFQAVTNLSEIPDKLKQEEQMQKQEKQELPLAPEYQPEDQEAAERLMETSHRGEVGVREEEATRKEQEFKSKEQENMSKEQELESIKKRLESRKPSLASAGLTTDAKSGAEGGGDARVVPRVVVEGRRHRLDSQGDSRQGGQQEQEQEGHSSLFCNTD